MRLTIILARFDKIKPFFRFLKINNRMTDPQPGQTRGEVSKTMIRTDLALEAHALWRESAGETTELPGVRARQWQEDGLTLDLVEILDRRGREALGKPEGRYVTVSFADSQLRGQAETAARVLGQQLAALLPAGWRSALVVGLGNVAVTPDAVGPLAVRSVLVTRHLRQHAAPLFGALRDVCALTPGVLASTGVESAEIVQAVTQRVRPDVVVVVDALAAWEAARLCRTIQLSDAGIVPGSGIANHRTAFDQQTLGVPVVAVGVPTVVDAATLARDLGGTAAETGLIVTPADIDASVAAVSRVVGWGIDLALQPTLTVEDLPNYGL
jgi:spore protease